MKCIFLRESNACGGQNVFLLLLGAFDLALRASKGIHFRKRKKKKKEKKIAAAAAFAKEVRESHLTPPHTPPFPILFLFERVSVSGVGVKVYKGNGGGVELVPRLLLLLLPFVELEVVAGLGRRQKSLSLLHPCMPGWGGGRVPKNNPPPHYGPGWRVVPFLGSGGRISAIKPIQQKKENAHHIQFPSYLILRNSNFN